MLHDILTKRIIKTTCPKELKKFTKYINDTFVFSTLTTSSIGHDALVPSTTAVHNSVVDTSVVVGERLYQRRVVEVGSTMVAAIVVVAVPAAIVPVVRCKDRDMWFPS